MLPNILTQRAVVRLSPSEQDENVREFLQGLVTNDVSGDLPVYAALLSAQGKAMFDFFVWANGDDILLDCEADLADNLVKRLSLYRLRRKITIERDPILAVHWSLDPNETGVPDPRHEQLGFRWLAAPQDSEQPADAAYLAHRLAHELTNKVWAKAI